MKTEQTFFTSIQRTFINLVSTSHRKVSPRLTTWTIFSINNFCLKIIAFYYIRTLIYPRPPIYNLIYTRAVKILDYRAKKGATKDSAFSFHSFISVVIPVEQLFGLKKTCLIDFNGEQFAYTPVHNVAHEHT